MFLHIDVTISQGSIHYAMGEGGGERGKASSLKDQIPSKKKKKKKRFTSDNTRSHMNWNLSYSALL